HHSLLCIPPLLSAPLALHSFPTRRSSDLTLFTATKNYTYDTALASTNSPFGDKGFVVVRKGGDASILRKNNATAPSGQEAAFQRSEEHTSELSHRTISYAVFCLKKKTQHL